MQVKNYINDLFTVLEKLEFSNKQGELIDFEQGTQQIMTLFSGLYISDSKLIFIGNGGSAAIASHMAIDYWKNGGIPALCFNDGAQLTCLSNDYGYDAVFEKPIQVFARPGDILIAISSSGQSSNILKGVEAAIRVGCKTITFSGFSPLNPLRKQGDINIYSASHEYGFVELTHQLVLHMILDLMCAGGKENANERSTEQSSISG
ncbi:MAG: phosphoheptose isomerase [Firmicutes bacterium HGW-Firmicutes-15]|nr:MAG: phosphoheptose isomerase [Firmicutes bacterium HGW-Firmicutes-15]